MEPEKKPVKIRIPSNALVVMVGASGSGKTTLAKRLFGEDKVVSSDDCRRLLRGGFAEATSPTVPSDDLQTLSEGAFVLFLSWVRARLRHGQLTVADSTALRPEYREALAKIAQEEHVRVFYLFADTPLDACVLRNALRGADKVPDSVIKRQFSSLSRSRAWLRRADNAYTVRPSDEVVLDVVDGIQGIDAAAIDVIGDVHGCLVELVELVEKLGYVEALSCRMPQGDNADEPIVERLGLYKHPEGRKLVFVGDLIDRGPEPYKVLDFVRRHVQAGLADLVLSNHERKLRQFLSGRNVNVKPAFQKTLDSIPADADKKALKGFLHSLRPYRTWTSPSGEEWVVVHAAFDPAFAGKIDGKIEEFCVYGPVNGVDPVTHRPDRIDWWKTYRPGPKVVYGHIITDDGQPRVVNGTYGIDTGCVHGGSLTALRLPEGQFVQVKARQVYYGTHDAPDPAKAPVVVPGTASLDILQSRRVTVRDHEGRNKDIFLRDRGLYEAIDALSTRTISPDKLVWLSPTMSPGPVSEDPSLMEDPAAAAKWLFGHAPEGTRLSAQAKHMGSRGTWLCERKDGVWAIQCWTRNGYEMFDEPRRAEVYEAMQAPLREIARRLEVFLKKEVDTLLLDSEVMPFNQHGEEWLERTFMQTAAAGHASRFAMARATALSGRREEAERLSKRMENIRLYGEAANRFCWPVAGAKDVRVGIFDVLYPFHGMTHSDLGAMVSEACSGHDIVRRSMRPADSMLVENTMESMDALMDWFKALTQEDGLEGLVLKYNDPNQWSASKYPQRMLKVRGKDYLRIVYGPQYLEPDILAALRKERRVEGKMHMAYQQSLLGREALVRRFGEGRPFEAWHECVIGILGAEHATVDPRL